ncbi:MAG: UDP-N-acetylglucosamine 2-epimerase (non-hydrolyzing) [Ignavibacteriales bacterium]|nr:UDP-N-acetylglucosamine 2-epimerase (non-hydrolyzing) [Ignavibacteriales bacterium]
MKKIMIVFGTRPETIKLAPVIQALKSDKYFETIVCSTGQHREMLHQVLDIFNLSVDDDLDLMKPDQTLFDITANSLTQLKSSIEKYNPDILMVQGDTTTAFTSALAAFYKKIKIAHVEAGLRSYDLFHPYPEEANRRFISVLANFNFVPTLDSKENLIKEGFDPRSIYVTGNTVVDALHQIKLKLDKPEFADQIRMNFETKYGSGLFNKKFILITLHRREKFGDELEELLRTLKELAEKYSDYNFIYPVHMNPNVTNPVSNILSKTKNFILTEPMDYLQFLYLMSKCHFIMSDSGGVQEECFVFNKPIIVMREVTERNEAVRAGYAFLTGSNREKIFTHFREIDFKLENGFNYFTTENPFGDGNASQRIVEILKQNYQTEQ